MIQCTECRLNLASFLAMNYNSFQYNQMPNSPLQIVQTQSLFEPAAQIPLLQKKNNLNN